jgi:hypothetical protein
MEEKLMAYDNINFHLRESERDWKEDFAHENGNYTCICVTCKKQFIGHKRRVVCNVCAETSKIVKISY